MIAMAQSGVGAAAAAAAAAAGATPPRRRKSGVVGVFWDIENCAVPHGKAAGGVAERVRALPSVSGRAEMEFVVVCDVTKQQEDVVNDLNAAQVTVQHVAAGRKKNAADEKLRQDMKRFVDTHAAREEVTVVLISGDQVWFKVIFRSNGANLV